MGKLISNLLENQVYSIGLYAFEGETMDVWRRNKIKIAKPSTNSIENKLHINDSESKATFINFSKIIDKNNLWTTKKLKRLVGVYVKHLLYQVTNMMGQF